MGIEDFWSNLNVLFPTLGYGMSENHESQRFDHIFIDINQVLYGFCRVSSTDEALLGKVTGFLDTLLSMTPPNKTLFLAVDGPGPRAKILIQRSRRSKMVEKRESRNILHDQTELRFTPGTEFMYKFKQYLCIWAAERAKRLHWANVKFIVSGPDREGEGEFKIFEHLNHMSTIQASDELALPSPYDPKDSILIVGGDSDLVLGSLKFVTERQMNITVMRQLTIGKYTMYPIKDLLHLLSKNLRHHDITKLVEDFSLLVLLCGCDYIPRLSGLLFSAAYRRYRWLREHPEFRNRNLLRRKEEDGKSASYEFDLEFLGQIIREASAASARASDVLSVTVNGRTKTMAFALCEFKGVLNNLLAQVRGAAPLFVVEQNVNSIEPRTEFRCRVKLKYTATGEEKLVEEAYGPSKKAAEQSAAIKALSPGSLFITQILTPLVSQDSLALLTTFFNRSINIYEKARGGVVSEDFIDSATAFDSSATSCIPPAPQHAQSAREIQQNNTVALQTYQEYFKILLWSLEYYQGKCFNYNMVYPFFRSPNAYTLSDLCLKLKKLEVSLDVPPPIDTSHQSQREKLITPQVHGHLPFVPVAFFLAVMPYMKSTHNNLTPGLRPEHYNFTNKEVLEADYNNETGTIAFTTHIKEFMTSVTSSPSVNKLNLELLKSTVGFQPSLMFFRRPDSWQTAIPKANSHTLGMIEGLGPLHFFPSYINATSLASLTREGIRDVVCLAEADDAADSLPTPPRRFSRLSTAFMLPETALRATVTTQNINEFIDDAIRRLYRPPQRHKNMRSSALMARLIGREESIVMQPQVIQQQTRSFFTMPPFKFLRKTPTASKATPIAARRHPLQATVRHPKKPSVVARLVKYLL